MSDIFLYLDLFSIISLHICKTADYICICNKTIIITSEFLAATIPQMKTNTPNANILHYSLRTHFIFPAVQAVSNVFWSFKFHSIICFICIFVLFLCSRLNFILNKIYQTFSFIYFSFNGKYFSYIFRLLQKRSHTSFTWY